MQHTISYNRKPHHEIGKIKKTFHINAKQNNKKQRA